MYHSDYPPGGVLAVVLAVAVCSLSAAYLLARRSRSRARHLVTVGRVAQIHIYPIKACTGIALQEAECTIAGWKHPALQLWDRHFSLMDKNGLYINATRHPRITLVTTSIRNTNTTSAAEEGECGQENEGGDSLVINAPGMRALYVPLAPTGGTVITNSIWGEDAPGYDCGDEASSWFSEYLSADAVRLIYSAQELPKRVRTEQKDAKYRAKAREHDVIAYQNYAAYLMTSLTSLDDVNANRKSDDDVKYPMDRFRPNIVVEGIATPWDEDNFDEVYIGDTKLVNLKLCPRCPVTTVDPATGVKDADPYKLRDTITSVHRVEEFFPKACFGINLFPDHTGTIKVGDDVRVLYKRR